MNPAQPAVYHDPTSQFLVDHADRPAYQCFASPVEPPMHYPSRNQPANRIHALAASQYPASELVNPIPLGASCDAAGNSMTRPPRFPTCPLLPASASIPTVYPTTRSIRCELIQYPYNRQAFQQHRRMGGNVMDVHDFVMYNPILTEINGTDNCKEQCSPKYCAIGADTRSCQS